MKREPHTTIQLLTLINDRTPIERFDVSGPFDFTDELRPLEVYRNIALEARPDLKAAVQNVELARITYRLAVANGSTDPTFSVWYSHNPSFANPYANETMGGSVSIPLRIFDRNQGEKARTQVDIGRNERLRDANEALVFSDVDSAYWTIVQNVNLLKPYKTTYLPLATDVRDTTAFSFKNGGASLLDYLDAEQAYRDTRLAYLNLIGSRLCGRHACGGRRGGRNCHPALRGISGVIYLANQPGSTSDDAAGGVFSGLRTRK